MNIALLAFCIGVAISIFLYFRPTYLSEGFATIALDETAMPKCFLRDAEAQQLLARFAHMEVAPASDAAMAREELTIILQKVLCIDADITGSGAGSYSTYRLQFQTSHDIEPAASFVGRCIRQAVRSRDVETAMGKFEMRGSELIGVLCSEKEDKQSAINAFHNIISRVTQSIMQACLTPKASMDIPAGPRDPGYYESPSIRELSPYTISGNDKQYL